MTCIFVTERDWNNLVPFLIPSQRWILSRPMGPYRMNENDRDGKICTTLQCYLTNKRCICIRQKEAFT